MHVRHILWMLAWVTSSALATGQAPLAAQTSSEIPKLKPGLWQMSSPQAEAAGAHVYQCLDEDAQRLFAQRAGDLAEAAQSACGNAVTHRDGASFVDERSCTIGHYQTRTRTDLRMSGDSAYHLEMTTHYEPAMFGKSVSTTIADARWVGACAADQKPGEIFVQAPGHKELMRMPSMSGR